MIWLLLVFLIAALLGFYDVFKKKALQGNAVLPVLFLNTLFSSLIFLPVALLPEVPFGGWEVQKYIVLKSLIVLSSWICGYYGMKYLPITVVGPINATRPVMVLVGALLVFGERLNLYQWIGVSFAILSFYLLSRSGKKEGIDFRHNRWIVLTVLAAVFGAVSGLYDKYLMASLDAGGVGLNRLTVQAYFNFYQCAIMGIICGLTPNPSLVERGVLRGWSRFFPSLQGRGRGWVFWVFLVSLFLCLADFAYFYALSLPGAMISVVSMVRRGSVLVSFTVGALLFHEKNLRSKAVDLALVLIGMLFLYLGAR